MNFLLDENFPKAACPYLKEAGHEVGDVRTLIDEGAPNSQVMELAIQRRSVVLTTDRDF